MRALLDDHPELKIRVLVGINVDIHTAHLKLIGLDFFKQHAQTKDAYLAGIEQDIQEARYDAVTEQGILHFIEDLIDGRLVIKAHPDKRLHAKVYIFRPEPFNEHTPASVITGSSNLTDPGLGIGKNVNYEFNVLLKDYEDVQFATKEFERLWNEAIDILPVAVQQSILKKTYLNESITPFELYIKLLIEFFGKSLEYDPDSVGDLPSGFHKLSYQIDAVNEGYQMLMEHNGFFLADVVGLGKTIVAAMLAKKFVIQNGRPHTKILVVHPPTLELSWKRTFKQFGLARYTEFISNGSLHKILKSDGTYWNLDEYDLVLVDEAHRFRNHTSRMFSDLQRICKAPRTGQGKVVGEKKLVVLISATPLNNSPEDLYYLVQLFQDARRSTLPVTNLTAFFAPLIDRYKRLKRASILDLHALRDLYARIRKNVVEPVSIRRTRTDLQSNQRYMCDLNAQGIVFPEVAPPRKIEYVLDDALNLLFYETVVALLDQITYYRYQAISFLVKPEHQQLYEQAELASKSLAAIMRTLLIKRLESSFAAFRQSLRNFHRATENMIRMFEKNCVFIAPDTNVNQLIAKGWDDDQIQEKIEALAEENPKNKVFAADDFAPELLDGLEQDAKTLKALVELWEEVDQDPKLNEFIQCLPDWLDPSINSEQKIVVFTEANDTVVYLNEALQTTGRTDVLAVSSKNRKRLYHSILKNFDANLPEDEQEDTFKIILTTEVLAEGVNLHRANVVVNYDTPWNATKLMQRIGRVNRIGTRADRIHNIIFYPSAEGDEQLRLNRTALMKLQGFHSAFGEDNQIYSENEVLDPVKLFRDGIQEERDERLEYLEYLRRFYREHPAEFKRIKTLPLKIRTGRKHTDRSNETVVFLKSKRKFEFYRVSGKQKVEEITPLDAIKIFEARHEEPATHLIDCHHDHVQLALKHFSQSVEQDQLSHIHPDAQSGDAQRAKKFLRDMSRYTKSPEKYQILIRLIDEGRYVNLPGQVAKISKQVRKGRMNQVEIMAELQTLTRQYADVHTNGTETSITTVEIPQLILSESFA